MSCCLIAPIWRLCELLSTRIVAPEYYEGIANSDGHRDQLMYKNPISYFCTNFIFLFIGLLLTYIFQTSIKDSILKVVQITSSVLFLIALLSFIISIIQIVFLGIFNPESDSYSFFKAKIAVPAILIYMIVMIILYFCRHPISVENGFVYISEYLLK